MFDSIGWGEILVLALAALFIFGPERLPHLAKDAAAGLKRVRAALTGVREQMTESFGDDLPELRDLDLRKYHPKTFIRSQLLDDDPPSASRGGSGSTASSHAAASTIAARRTAASRAAARDRSVPPPFDVDAT